MHFYKDVVKRYLAKYVCKIRVKQGLTKEKMAEYLRISPRSYFDLERGRFCFSGPSLIFFLAMLSDEDVICLLNDFREMMSLYDGDA